MFSFSMLAAGFTDVISFSNLFLILISVLGGIIIGALPGLTAVMAISLLVSVTYSMDTLQAVIVMASLWCGAVYGGSNSAILLNIPGTPAAGATAIEGNQLAKKGEAGRAIGVSATSSFVGGQIGVVVMLIGAPILANFALKFGVWEYFLLAFWGISISALLAGDDFIKGMMSGIIGMLISTIGMDSIYAFPRFTFGTTALMAGISLTPAMIGMFGIGEVLCALQSANPPKVPKNIGSFFPPISLFVKNAKTLISSALIGTGIGALPGAGADIAPWVSYGVAKRISKKPEEYGTGCYEGLIAAETANNATIGGAFIPTLILGVPGCAVTAVILSALTLHGVRPGPTLFLEQANFVYAIAIALFIANFVMLAYGLTFAPYISNILQLPRTTILPIVVMLTVVGAYAVNIRMTDITVMFCFGMLGFLMRKLSFPAPPMILGIILGPMADENFRRSMLTGAGSLMPYFTRPICIGLIIIIFIMISANFGLFSIVKKIFKKDHNQNNN